MTRVEKKLPRDGNAVSLTTEQQDALVAAANRVHDRTVGGGERYAYAVVAAELCELLSAGRPRGASRFTTGAGMRQYSSQ